jgi:hypothetical protein
MRNFFLITTYSSPLIGFRTFPVFSVVRCDFPVSRPCFLYYPTVNMSGGGARPQNVFELNGGDDPKGGPQLAIVVCRFFFVSIMGVARRVDEGSHQIRLQNLIGAFQEPSIRGISKGSLILTTYIKKSLQTSKARYQLWYSSVTMGVLRCIPKPSRS